MRDNKRSLSKKDVVTAQLETAIKLFFEHRDLISTLTLTAAADEILDDLYQKNKDEIAARRLAVTGDSSEGGINTSWNEIYKIYVRPEYQKEWFTKLRDPQNFFKHADRDPYRILDFGGKKFVEVKLFAAITNFHLVYGEFPMSIRAFFLYYLTRNPKILSEGQDIYDLLTGIYEQKADLIGCSDQEAIEATYQALKYQCPHLFRRPLNLSETD